MVYSLSVFLLNENAKYISQTHVLNFAKISTCGCDLFGSMSTVSYKSLTQEGINNNARKPQTKQNHMVRHKKRHFPSEE